MKIKVTRSNYDEIKNYLREFLIEEIENYTKRAGNQTKLSLALGREDAYVHIKLKRALRGNFSGLERLWRECIEKLQK
jgi:hypothetical protein